MCVRVLVYWCFSPSGLLMSSVSEVIQAMLLMHTAPAFIPAPDLQLSRLTSPLCSSIVTRLPFLWQPSSVFLSLLLFSFPQSFPGLLSYPCIKDFLSMRKVCELRLGKRWKINRIVKISMWFQTCMTDFLLWKTKGEILKNVCAAPFQFNDSERKWTKGTKHHYNYLI